MSSNVKAFILMMTGVAVWGHLASRPEFWRNCVDIAQVLARRCGLGP
jgi:hypothetical protein